MNRLTLKFLDEAINCEYSALKCGSLSENFRVTTLVFISILLKKLILYFLALYQLSIGVPAIIHANLLGFLVSLGVVVLLVVISLFRKTLLNYHQFIAYLILVVFHFVRPYIVPGDLDNNSKGVFLLRGYAIASLQLPLIIRFPELRQKIWGVIFGFGFRFLIMGLLDNETYDPQIIARHIFIDSFVIYMLHSSEKTEKNVFRNFYEFREKLTKFKQLVDNYLPQSIIIVNPYTNQCLFANKASLNFFKKIKVDPLNEGKVLNEIKHEDIKIGFNRVIINKETVNAMGSLQFNPDLASTILTLEDLVSEFATNKLLSNHALSLSASCNFEDSRYIFGVIMTKIRWDEEDAIAIVLNDNTHQEKLLALKIANENKDKILATVSHELRTPLSGIIGILDIVESRINESEVVEYLNLCKDNAKLLLGLVNSLLDIQQIKEGKLKLNITKVNIRKVFRDIIRLFQFQCNQKDIYLNLKVSERIPESIYTDENRLKQILINLVGNAIKFTFQGGITMGVIQHEEKEESLRVWVADTGIGIKEEDKGKLFKMYSKLEDGELVNENGVGLGLTISNVLAELLRGTKEEKGIHIESTFGKGTEFWFELPKDLRSVLNEKNRDDTLAIKMEESELKKMVSESVELDEEEDINFEHPKGFELKLKYLQLKQESPNLRGPHLEKKVYNMRFQRYLTMNYTEPCKEDFILLVDDNPFNLMVGKANINKAGYLCVTANNGKEAIEKVKITARKTPFFKVILMDQQMPIMNGPEATKILREMMNRNEIPKVPIIALTASNDEESLKECFQSGMSGYLKKPLQVDSLQNIISKLT